MENNTAAKQFNARECDRCGADETADEADGKHGPLACYALPGSRWSGCLICAGCADESSEAIRIAYHTPFTFSL